MKTIRSRGRFSERPFYEAEEIERIAAEELATANLMPDSPGPVRIERFIEKRFGTSPSYDELDWGVLGFTRFGSKGVEEIVVSRSLGEEGTVVAERRVNTTLAHEAGHGLLHAHLFGLGGFNASLFEDEDVTASQVLCRTPGDSHPEERSYDGRWWEVQANMMMGALLLPKRLVMACLEPLLERRGSLGVATLGSSQWDEAPLMLAEVFDVNPVVGRIRLSNLFPTQDDTQLTL